MARGEDPAQAAPGGPRSSAPVESLALLQAAHSQPRFLTSVPEARNEEAGGGNDKTGVLGTLETPSYLFHQDLWVRLRGIRQESKD